MTSTTDRYRRHHGDTAYAALAARAALAGMEPLAAELAGRGPAPRVVPLPTVAPSGPTRRPGPIAGRDTRGRALPPSHD